MPDAPGNEGTDWLFGAFACLESGAHDAPRGGETKQALVPVAFSPNDVIYFLDGDGRAWAQDTIENPAATPFASDGDRMVARILVFEIALERRFTGVMEELEGKRGKELAIRLGLPLVTEASDELALVWADERTVVIEQQRTTGGPWQTLLATRDRGVAASLTTGA